MTPDEARELLERFFESPTTEAQAGAEQAWLQARLLNAIMKGPRAAELAQLNFEATTLEDEGHDAAEQRASQQAIYEEIQRQLLLELAEKGLPPAWQPE